MPFRLIKEATKEKDAASRYEAWDRIEGRFGAAVVVGLLIETGLVFWLPEPWLIKGLTLVSDALIAGGVWGELWAGNKARTAGDAIVQEAKARASEADLKRAELEIRLQPRMTDQRQFDLIQSLCGKLEEISIIHNASAEPRWFSSSLRDAFFAAGIRVGMYRLSPDNPTEGVFIYDPAMRGAKASSVCELLVDVFRGTDTPVAMLTGLLLGVSDVPTEYPAIIVGERFAVLPPHITKAMQMADAAYAKMKKGERRT